VGLDVSLELLVGHLWRMAAQDHQDLDGGWGELGDEPVGEAGGHPVRCWPTHLRFDRGGVADGAGRLLLV
jgi:hypothetical protein